MSRLNRAYLSLGGNIEPAANMRAAFHLLAEQTDLVAVSTVWETRPLGPSKQPNYLNCAAIVDTPLSAVHLRESVLRGIEAQLGRVRQADKFAPRPMDIDIMFFNEDILTLGQRHIPDAEVLERAFVAIPLAELAPDYVHPETGQTLREIAAQFSEAKAQMIRRPDVRWAGGG